MHVRAREHHPTDAAEGGAGLGSGGHDRVVRLLPLRHRRRLVFDKLFFNGLDGRINGADVDRGAGGDDAGSGAHDDAEDAA